MTDVLKGEKQFAASAILVTDETPKRTLLVHHKKHNVWVNPGGHMETFENPIEAVIREVQEETGIDISFLKHDIRIMKHSSVLPIPDFFLEEIIPEYNGEPSHFHLDLIYIVHVTFQEAKKQIEESNDIGWFTLEEALKLPLFDNSEMMLKKILA